MSPQTTHDSPGDVRLIGPPWSEGVTSAFIDDCAMETAMGCSVEVTVVTGEWQGDIIGVPLNRSESNLGLIVVFLVILKIQHFYIDRIVKITTFVQAAKQMLFVACLIKHLKW